MSELRCDPMTRPDVMIEHYGPLRPGEPCGWQISFTDRARPDAPPLFVWDSWDDVTCVQANQLTRILRDSPGIMAALHAGDLQWAYEQVDAITHDVESGWSA